MKPRIAKLKGGLFPKYKLLKKHRFTFTYGARKAYFNIPPNFEYDGATFGSFLFWRKSLHETAYTLAHDWGYINLGKVGARYSDGTYIGDLSKKTLDKIWLDGARKETNVQGWRSAIASGAFKTIGLLLWKRREWFNGT